MVKQEPLVEAVGHMIGLSSRRARDLSEAFDRRVMRHGEPMGERDLVTALGKLSETVLGLDEVMSIVGTCEEAASADDDDVDGDDADEDMCWDVPLPEFAPCYDGRQARDVPDSAYGIDRDGNVPDAFEGESVGNVSGATDLDGLSPLEREFFLAECWYCPTSVTYHLFRDCQYIRYSYNVKSGFVGNQIGTRRMCAGCVSKYVQNLLGQNHPIAIDQANLMDDDLAEYLERIGEAYGAGTCQGDRGYLRD